MHIFTITERVSIACEWKKTRSAFKHEAALLINGSEQERVKICYLNRTWEQYEFQSVIHKLLEKSRILTKEEKTDILKHLDGTDGYNGAGCKRDMAPLQSIGAIAALGDIIHAGDAKASNDWKTRMLKAGLEGRGLSMPEDWETLDEAAKQTRLDGAIKQLAS